ncbi:MAG: LuxR C-terminal-related transcriptional regulator [Synergistaceae bacterium]|nr:LuxR C-terminal-related transcriptional regulator [Synergistaceae bacterium]
MNTKNDSVSGLYYFPDRLKKRLFMIPDHPVTIVEAPSGFGKTTAVREYLKNALDASKKPAEEKGVSSPEFKSVWSIIGEENHRNEWNILCDAMKKADGELGTELEKLSVPYNDDDVFRMGNILRNAEEKEDTFIVLDNYQFVRDRIPPKYMESLFHSLPPKLHLVFVSQLVNPVSISLAGNARVNHIKKDCLNFDADDIRSFFKLYNLRITKEQANEINHFTEGWIAAIYLTLLRYAEEGKFSDAEDVSKLMENTVWNRLSADERQFLLKMSRFDSFDIELARFMNETEDIDKKILTMLERNGFVYYRSEERRYFVHGLLQDYVRREFEAESLSFRARVLRSTAGWYESRSQNFLALKYYSAVNDFEALLRLKLASSDFTATASAENKALLLSVMERCPKDVLMGHPKALLVFAFTLFVYNEKERLLDLCGEVQKALAETRGCGGATPMSIGKLTEAEKHGLAGELVFLTAFLEHNDFAKMADGYRRAYELLGGPTTIINRKGPWTFGSPSVLYMFYRDDAEADTACLEKNLGAYLRVANGHGTSADMLMRGELQFNQGKIQDAEISAHRALYVADGHEQLNLALCACFLLAQIAVAKGDGREYRLHIKNLKERAENSRLPVYLTMVDLCLGFLFAVTDGAISCPSWLGTDEVLSRVRFMTRPYVDIVLSKSLLLSKEYAKLAGTGEEMSKKAAYYPNGLAEIYIALHLSLAYERLGNKKGAEETLSSALSLALPNRIIMPLAQNYETLRPVLQRLGGIDEETRRRIAELAARWSEGVEELKKASEHILSGREREVALLVSQGLTNQEIAKRLFISYSTVKSLLDRAFKKTETQSRVELSAWLLQNRNIKSQ